MEKQNRFLQHMHVCCWFKRTAFIFILGFTALSCLQGERGKSPFKIFPLNIGFNSDNSLPSSDPPSNQKGSLTYYSANMVYVSGQSGAFEYADVQWSSSLDASYQIRLGATNCTDGTLDSSGSVQASVATTSRIHALIGSAPLIVGANQIKICIFNPGGSTYWDSYNVTAMRDDTAPTVSYSPVGGVFGTSAPTITISCSDTGNSGCNQIAYRTDGTTAAIANNGTAAPGNTLFSSALPLANNTTTNMSAIAVDYAGNIGVAGNATYTVSFGNPTITIVSLSKSIINGSGSSTLVWNSDIGGNYSIRSSGTNCSDGTVLLTGSATAGTNVNSVIAGSALNAGVNNIRICLTTPGTNQGSVSTSVARDDIAPKVIAVAPLLTPNATAFALSVTQKTFSLTFDEDMDTTVSIDLKHYDQTQGNREIKWPGAIGSWSSDKRTYTLNTQSNLPEWHKFFWRYSDVSFKDLAGNNVVTSPLVAVVAGEIKLNYGTTHDTAYLHQFDTLQNFCTDSNGANVVCTSTGQDAEQTTRGGYQNSNTFFTFPMLAAGFPSDFVTKDTKNNRYWKSCEPDYETDGMNPCLKICPGANKWNGTACVSDSGNPKKTFERAVEDCSELNVRNAGAGYAGRKGWRVPTIAEYYTILEYADYGGNGTDTIPNRFFPGITRNDYQRYWTSTNAITINTTNRYALTPAIDPLSNGPVNYAAPSSLQTWAAWTVSVFGGVALPNNKQKSSAWDSPAYYFTTLCISD
ncbi:DUF1566 domain-containing protein [Leptospira sp. FAT2]|uniref:Lcl domain-containing protein n=1 Tax=Leptospira sanjuanensis TaxID=2879643 RepID=UPI001EE946AF|nr:DUF1566 domain-containing protein [Leptospira sanjuanensis]MCG6192325.1 DUF1566 domain-containing protein [Leptospira sanjuanensis]